VSIFVFDSKSFASANFVYIFPNFDTDVNTSFLGYLHMRQRFFTRFFILTLTFFGTKHFSSCKIF